MTDTSKTTGKGAMRAAGAIVTGCAIGLMTFAEASEIIEHETHAGEMAELLRDMLPTLLYERPYGERKDLRDRAERLLKELES